MNDQAFPAPRIHVLMGTLLATVVSLILAAPVWADNAPGAPGEKALWTTGAKDGLGTSTTATSKVWFTLCKGVLSEVFYPQADTPNVQDLQLVVTDSQAIVDLERDATCHRIELTDSHALSYRQTNTKAGKYRITKTYVTDPARSALLIQTRFETLSGGPYRLYVLYNPALNNTGMGDTGATVGNALVSSDGNVASALICSPGFSEASNGYSGTESDGYRQLATDKELKRRYDTAATPGNLVQIARVPSGSDTTFVLALGFGADRQVALATASACLQVSYDEVKTRYETGWHDYLGRLNPTPACLTTEGLKTQYNVAIMALKAHEDKTFRGAHVASLCTPWGDVKDADPQKPEPGYHRVWARDLYQVATAMLAAGDADAARASLHYLFQTQQLSDGSFPRYSTLDGRDHEGDEQLDQDAFPIILAWQLGQKDAAIWEKVKSAAKRIVDVGPPTPKERWEEESGNSPSTIAAEIAGLICAADIARANHEADLANSYESTADEWQQNIEKWTYTTKGYFGNHEYYERIDSSRDPNDEAKRDFKDGSFWERDVLDAGFLELVRLGVKPANDSKIAHSLDVIDQQIKVVTPAGDMWHRYNHDSYGENDDTGVGWKGEVGDRGRLWPLLSGERGEYELANGRTTRAFELLKTMANAANDGYLIPEQCWDRPNALGFEFGKGTGSATPLAWSMAQFVRLAVSIDAGKPVETPGIVAQRYEAHR